MSTDLTWWFFFLSFLILNNNNNNHTVVLENTIMLESTYLKLTISSDNPTSFRSDWKRQRQLHNFRFEIMWNFGLNFSGKHNENRISAISVCVYTHIWSQAGLEGIWWQINIVWVNKIENCIIMAIFSALWTLNITRKIGRSTCYLLGPLLRHKVVCNLSC